MLLQLFLKYSDYIIAAGRIAFEIVNLLNFGFTVQTLIWINALEANLDDENIDILMFLGLQNEYKYLLWGLKVLLIIHSIITWLKFVTTCCILVKMCWNKNRNNIYKRMAKYKYRNHLILPTTQQTNSPIFARSQDSSGPSEPRNLSNPPTSQDQHILHDTPVVHAVIVHEDRTNRTQNSPIFARSQDSSGPSELRNLSNPPTSKDQAILHNRPIVHAAIVHENRTNRSQNMKSLKEIDSMIERVLHRANGATSQDSSGPRDAHILHAAIGHEDTTNAANQNKILARSEDSSGPSDVRSLSNLPISQDQAILHDAQILHEDTTNRSQNSSSPTHVTNLSTNHSSQDSSTPTEVNNLSTNKSSQDKDRRYPLRKRTESSRYPEATYQKDTP